MSKLHFPLHPKQWTAFTSLATEILYGGAAGAAKSHLIRVAAIMWALAVPGLQLYIFRRTYDDLIKNHMEGPTGFHALLAPWIGKYVEIVEKEIRFNNGSKIYLAHCQHEKNRFDYQGAEIHVLLIDELTHFTEVIYRFLRSRVRMPGGMVIPEKYKEMFPRILCGSNPGGIGHQWVKSSFIDYCPAFQIKRTEDAEGGFLRQFIPARLADNPSIDQDSYSRNLSGLGNEALVEAMLKGDWDIVSGAALNIDRQIHMIRPFKPPQHLAKFQVIDWGYVKPYAVGWFCVMDQDTILAEKDEWPEMLLPKNSLVMYRELYGTNGKPDEGSKEESDIVARRIIQIEEDANEHMDYRVADTAMWAKNDGMSIFERMNKATKGKFNPRQSIKDRQAGYSEINSRLKGEQLDKNRYVPMLYVTSNCQHWWRTCPPLVLDDLQPEKGPDSSQEDHCFALGTMIITNTGNRKIEDILTGDMVLTTEGFKPCIQLGITGTKQLYDVDGLLVTGNHPFLTAQGVYVRVDELCTKLSHLQSRNLTASLIGCVGNIIKDAAFVCIGSFGNFIKGILPRAIISITKIMTDLIMIFPILPLSCSQNICPITRRDDENISLCTLRELEIKLPYGISQKKAGDFIPYGQKGESIKQSIKLTALNVAKNLWQNVRVQYFAAKYAQPEIGERNIPIIIKTSRIENVVNLHVPGPNNFVLANGMIVHNCYDMSVYACMSRPFIRTRDQRIVTEFKKRRSMTTLDKVDPYRVKPMVKK